MKYTPSEREFGVVVEIAQCLHTILKAEATLHGYVRQNHDVQSFTLYYQRRSSKLTSLHLTLIDPRALSLSYCLRSSHKSTDMSTPNLSLRHQVIRIYKGKHVHR
jgi:hypothetical protein